ncbi:MAG: GFA family protein [Rhodospirillaceae bacterium]|nr:GFA family protein [Rhodospirillaceae bacterium]
MRYRIPRPIQWVHYCHCRMCQKAMGNVFAALAPAPKSAIVWTRGKPKIFRSSSAAERGFCAKCGTPLTFAYVDSKNLNVSIGSLDDPGAVAPDRHVGTEAQLPWLRLADDLPKSGTDVAALKRHFPKFQNHQHPDHDTRAWPPRRRTAP